MRERLAVALVLMSMALASVGQTLATADISVYPESAVADGRSTLTVGVTVRDRSGNYVPDGTQVAFTTSLGQFVDAVIGTSGGVARATLLVGNLPGKARVTASVVNFATVAEVLVDLVSDSSQLRKTATYLEAYGTTYLAYAVDLQLIAATGKDKSARVVYRDIEVVADDMQVDLRTMSVMAYNATVRTGGKELNATQLSYQLRGRSGVAMVRRDESERYVDVKNGVEAQDANREPGYDDFRFQELVDSTSVIVAQTIIVDPGRQALFNRARVYVGANKLITMDHYSVDLTRPGGLFNDQMFGVNQDGVSLDLPYYVSLGPRQSNSLRLRSQTSGGRTYTTSRGTTLDWVTKYSNSRSYSGDFTISDMASDKWGATIRHSQKLTDTLDTYFLLDSPRHDVLYGFSQLSQRFDGFHANLSFSGNEGISRDIGSDRRTDLAVDTDTTALIKKGLYHSFGVTTSYHSYTSDTLSYHQSGYGLRYRLRTESLRFGIGSVGAGMVVTKLWGKNAGDGVGIQGTVSSTMALGGANTLSLTYDYTQDQFSSSLLGKHRLSVQLFNTIGSLGSSIFYSRSLDLNYATLFTDSSVRLSKLWRVGFSYTLDDGLSSFTDRSFFLGYRLGFREVALRYSALTNRFGIELLAAGF